MEVNVPLALVTLLYKSDVILHQGRLIFPHPKQLMGDRLFANMGATCSFMDFGKYYGGFMFF